MIFIRDIHDACRAAGRPAVSFEFFPPKTDEGERAFFEKTLPQILALKPDYCSVTYGAGGTTREKTLGMADRIQRESRLPAMMHLTCVDSTREQLSEVVAEARQARDPEYLGAPGRPSRGW
jgi:methylenetetrahydrofolate reductase (NADPH)